MSLASASVSCDADNIINHTIAFLSSKCSKWGAARLLSCYRPLASASATNDADGTVNGTTKFLRSRQLKWGHVKVTALWIAPLISLGQNDQNDMQHDFFDHVTPLASLFVSHHATGFGVSIRCHQWHYQCHCCIPWVKIIDMKCNITFLVLWHHLHWNWHNQWLSLKFLGQDEQHELQHDSFDHVMAITITWYKWHYEWHMTLMLEMVPSLVPKVK